MSSASVHTCAYHSPKSSFFLATRPSLVVFFCLARIGGPPHSTAINAAQREAGAGEDHARLHLVLLRRRGLLLRLLRLLLCPGLALHAAGAWPSAKELRRVPARTRGARGSVTIHRSAAVGVAGEGARRNTPCDWTHLLLFAHRNARQPVRERRLRGNRPSGSLRHEDASRMSAFLRNRGGDPSGRPGAATSRAGICARSDGAFTSDIRDCRLRVSLSGAGELAGRRWCGCRFDLGPMRAQPSTSASFLKKHSAFNPRAA